MEKYKCSGCNKYNKRILIKILDRSVRKYKNKEGLITYGNLCVECRKKKQNEYIRSLGNERVHKYEKTKTGFLVRKYRNMKSRVTGVVKNKKHLYLGKELLGKQEFYEWAKNNKKFNKLFKEWENSGYERRLCPSPDRIDSSRGYCISNMEWVPFYVNCSRGAISKHKLNSN